MPELDQERRRRHAGAHLIAGGMMVGGAAATQDAIARKTKLKSTFAAAKDIKSGKAIKGKHLAHLGGWAGTRGVMAAGIPLAAVGAKNLVSPKPREVGRLNVKQDVVQPSVDRSTGGVVDLDRSDRKPRRARVAEMATVTAGSTAGGLGGAALARRAMKGGGRRLAAVGLGTAAGAVGGSLATAPLGRRAVHRATKGEYTYTTEEGIRRVHKSSLPAGQAIKELPQREQKQLIQRKKKQSKYSLASAGLGLTAFGLKAPALAGAAAKRSKRLSQIKPIKSFASHAPKTDAAATNLGIASLGVGGMGSLNFARIQRAETKADQRATAIKKAVEYSTIRQGAGEGLDPDYDYVEAHHKGKNIGYLKLRQGGEIDHIKVKPKHRRKGVATAMYRRAEEEGLNPRHSTALSRKGKAWKASLSGNRQRSEDVAKALVSKLEPKALTHVSKLDDADRASSSYDIASHLRSRPRKKPLRKKTLRRQRPQERGITYATDDEVDTIRWGHHNLKVRTGKYPELGERPYNLRNPKFENPEVTRHKASLKAKQVEHRRQSLRNQGHHPYRSEEWVNKRVLVTGSRDWDDEPEVHRQLDRLASEHPDIEVIEGGSRGADTHARNWAKKRGRKVSTYQADWKAHGRAAGPKRNQRMLEEGKPQRVLAFSRDLKNSKGTRDMVRRAERAGVRVDRYGEELAKALFPTRLFRPKPLGFGGVRAGGIRRTPTGRLVTYRGSMG